MLYIRAQGRVGAGASPRWWRPEREEGVSGVLVVAQAVQGEGVVVVVGRHHGVQALVGVATVRVGHRCLVAIHGAVAKVAVAAPSPIDLHVAVAQVMPVAVPVAVDYASMAMLKWRAHAVVCTVMGHDMARVMVVVAHAAVDNGVSTVTHAMTITEAMPKTIPMTMYNTMPTNMSMSKIMANSVP